MYKMRRQNQAMDKDEAIALLERREYGVLSTTDDTGQPYGVALHYIYKNGAIYFHCAHKGHKLDNIEKNPKVSFCVVGDVTLLPEKFTSLYENVVVFGMAVKTTEKERENAFLWLVEKYSPQFIEQGKKFIEKKRKITTVIKIEIDSITGKVGKA